MALEDLVKKLENIPNSEVDEFESVLVEVGKLEDPESVVALARFFRDDAPYEGLMWSLLRTVERTIKLDGFATYVERLLEALPGIWPRAPGWASILTVRISNSESGCPELIRQLKGQSPDKKAIVRQIVNYVVRENPEAKARLAAVLAATA